jgi:hypothetical protein
MPATAKRIERSIAGRAATREPSATRTWIRRRRAAEAARKPRDRPPYPGRRHGRGSLPSLCPPSGPGGPSRGAPPRRKSGQDVSLRLLLAVAAPPVAGRLTLLGSA